MLNFISAVNITVVQAAFKWLSTCSSDRLHDEMCVWNFLILYNLYKNSTKAIIHIYMCICVPRRLLNCKSPNVALSVKHVCVILLLMHFLKFIFGASAGNSSCVVQFGGWILWRMKVSLDHRSVRLDLPPLPELVEVKNESSSVALCQVSWCLILAVWDNVSMLLLFICSCPSVNMSEFIPTCRGSADFSFFWEQFPSCK